MTEPVLHTAFDELAALHRPILVIALRGWFDSAGVATDALDVLVGERVAPVVAAIDPDPFFDFTVERPTVSVDEDGVRSLHWPANEFRLIRRTTNEHDLIVLNGVEPHLRLATFADAIVEVAAQLAAEAVITIGAQFEAVPHTRLPRVVGSTTTPHLATRLGLHRPTYQGITGLIGVLLTKLDAARIPAISLRVPVPHYLDSAAHPRSTLALVSQLDRILGQVTEVGELHEAVEHWRGEHDRAVRDTPLHPRWLRDLERYHDDQVEREASAAGDIGAEFEAFLRQRRDDERRDDERPNDERRDEGDDRGDGSDGRGAT